MDRCGWCKKFNPTWDLLVKDYKKYLGVNAYNIVIPDSLKEKYLKDILVLRKNLDQIEP